MSSASSNSLSCGTVIDVHSYGKEQIIIVLVLQFDVTVSITHKIVVLSNKNLLRNALTANSDVTSSDTPHQQKSDSLKKMEENIIDELVGYTVAFIKKLLIGKYAKCNCFVDKNNELQLSDDVYFLSDESYGDEHIPVATDGNQWKEYSLNQFLEKECLLQIPPVVTDIINSSDDSDSDDDLLPTQCEIYVKTRHIVNK